MEEKMSKGLKEKGKYVEFEHGAVGKFLDSVCDERNRKVRGPYIFGKLDYTEKNMQAELDEFLKTGRISKRIESYMEAEGADFFTALRDVSKGLDVDRAAELRKMLAETGRSEDFIKSKVEEFLSRLEAGYWDARLADKTVIKKERALIDLGKLEEYYADLGLSGKQKYIKARMLYSSINNRFSKECEKYINEFLINYEFKNKGLNAFVNFTMADKFLSTPVDALLYILENYGVLTIEEYLNK